MALQDQQSLPVIDLKDIDQRSKIVIQASQEWGFFQIINHGIPDSLLESVKRVSQEFFELSPEEKRKQCPERRGIFMLEGYGRSFDVDALVHYISPESAKAVEHWPKTPSTYRETYENYGKEVMGLIEKLLSCLSEGLGLETNYIRTLNKEPLLQLRINYYPPRQQQDPVSGLKPHSDGDLLTVLLDNGVAGLQVRKDGRWFSVPSSPGALIINIGDLLEIVSNGKYKSAEHQAVMNTDQTRMSIVMFLSPQRDVWIRPAGKLIDGAHPAVYKEVTVEDYATVYMSQNLQGKSRLDALRINP